MINDIECRAARPSGPVAWIGEDIEREDDRRGYERDESELLLLELELDLAPTMRCGTCAGWGSIVKNGVCKPCPTCGGTG